MWEKPAPTVSAWRAEGPSQRDIVFIPLAFADWCNTPSTEVFIFSSHPVLLHFHLLFLTSMDLEIKCFRGIRFAHPPSQLGDRTRLVSHSRDKHPARTRVRTMVKNHTTPLRLLFLLTSTGLAFAVIRQTLKTWPPSFSLRQASRPSDFVSLAWTQQVEEVNDWKGVRGLKGTACVQLKKLAMQGENYQARVGGAGSARRFSCGRCFFSKHVGCCY